MNERNEKNTRKDKGDFIHEKKAVDRAINERIKAENESNKIDPRSANNPTKTEYHPHDSVKKTGRSKE